MTVNCRYCRVQPVSKARKNGKMRLECPKCGINTDATTNGAAMVSEWNHRNDYEAEKARHLAKYGILPGGVR